VAGSTVVLGAGVGLKGAGAGAVADSGADALDPLDGTDFTSV
jgi:hypothetical protein